MKKITAKKLAFRRLSVGQLAGSTGGKAYQQGVQTASAEGAAEGAAEGEDDSAGPKTIGVCRIGGCDRRLPVARA